MATVFGASFGRQASVPGPLPRRLDGAKMFVTGAVRLEADVFLG
jgi:hypothetical protein